MGKSSRYPEEECTLPKLEEKTERIIVLAGYKTAVGG